MTGFEPRTSGIGSDRYTNWATTTAQYLIIIVIPKLVENYHPISQSHVNGFEQFPWMQVCPAISQMGTEHKLASSVQPGMQMIRPRLSQ